MSNYRRTKFGISERLTLITTLIVVLSSVLVCALFVVGTQRQLTHRLHSEAKDALIMAQKTLAQPLWTFDKTAIASTCEGLFQSNQGMTIFIRVLDRDGNVIYEKTKLNEGGTVLSESEMRRDPRSFDAQDNIEYDKQRIGSVEMILSSEPLDQELQRLLTKVIVAFSISIIGVTMTLFFVIKFYLAKPIDGVVQLAMDLGNGRIVKPNNNWKHEFGIISNAFARASETILARDQSLREHNEMLEQEVEIRTRKLDEQRMVLTENSRMASLGEISAGIAHEINNPLAIINASSTRALRKLQGHEEFKPCIDDIQKTLNMVSRIAKIINGLRVFARDGSTEPKTSFKASKLFEDAKDLCQSRLNNHGVRLIVDVDDPNLTLFGRELQISQVLINLINNSADAISGRDDKWIRINGASDGVNGYIRVTDSGEGIPPHIRSKMMQPFFTTKEVGKGTGLGLSISHGILKDHGGLLSYDEHAPNTTFVLTLPNEDTVKKSA